MHVLWHDIHCAYFTIFDNVGGGVHTESSDSKLHKQFVLHTCRENNCPQCRMPMQSRRDCKKVLSFKLACCVGVINSVKFTVVVVAATIATRHCGCHCVCRQHYTCHKLNHYCSQVF